MAIRGLLQTAGWQKNRLATPQETLLTAQMVNLANKQQIFDQICHCGAQLEWSCVHHRRNKLSRQSKPLHSQQHPLCPTKNPHRSTLRPFSDAFTLRTPGFAQHHRPHHPDKANSEPSS
jgi:hypothetical protein